MTIQNASALDGLFVRRYTSADTPVYDMVTWETRDVVQTNRKDGSIIFEQRGVKVPSFWSMQSTEILASKYLHNQEGGLDEMLDRVVGAIVREGIKAGYFSEADGVVFGDELKYILMHQRAAFNSPVWFNIGKVGRAQTPSACFIMHVDDSLESITDWYRNEIRIFQSGSGSGANLSRIRSTKESIPGGLKASGPVSFMRGADATAGVIKSGSVVRNAAKMVILDVDHPDIMDFIWCKALEGRKARALKDAGFDMDVDGKDIISIQYQNANNSVRIPDEFMQAVINDESWGLVARKTGEVVDEVRARDIWQAIAESAWECADPGVQFSSTINRWNSLADTEEIVASNPCAEFLNIDNTSCNLSSLNLLKYLQGTDGAHSFSLEEFVRDCQMMFVAQDVLIEFGEFPTEEITYNTRRYRQIGLGYSNLGALLMCLGLPYDSDGGRQVAQAITSALSSAAYLASTDMARAIGACAGYEPNKGSIHRVLHMHHDTAVVDTDLLTNDMAVGIASEACNMWRQVVTQANAHGVRNTYVSNIAPTGCLVPDTLVPTSEGVIRLGAIGDQDGDQWQDISLEVSTDQGQMSATKFYVNGLANVVRITTEDGFSIAGTPEHRIKVVDQETGKWEWRRLGEVAPSDVVPLAMNNMVGSARIVDLPWADHGCATPRAMTPALAELIGYFQGRGTVHTDGLRFYVASDGLDVADYLGRLGKESFGIEARIEHKSDHLVVSLETEGLAQWWTARGFCDRSMGDAHSWDSYIPAAVLGTNDRDIYGAFLRGLFEASGDVVDGVPFLANVAPNLVQDTMALMLAMGIPTSRTGESGLRLGGDAQHAARFQGSIGFISDRKSDRVDAAAPVVVVSGDVPEFIFSSVRSATLQEQEMTLDLSVPQNVTYVANGFVSHNTISFLMGCDTTGVEPDLALIKHKKLVGGSSMEIVNESVPRALANLGYTEAQISDVVGYIREHNSVSGAPHLAESHYSVFACAMGSDNVIEPMGHVRMMGAISAYLSGGISKTVNMPTDTTDREIGDLYQKAWELGVKCVAIYRDMSKVGQPLNVAKTASNQVAEEPREAPQQLPAQNRVRLPRRRASVTTSFRISDVEGYLTVGEYEDGSPGEVFIKVSKLGSTLSGFVDTVALVMSLGLQYGVPLETYVAKLAHMKFDPAGMTNDPDIRMVSSIIDYVARRLALDYLPDDVRLGMGIKTVEERTEEVNASYQPVTESPAAKAPQPAAKLPRTRAVQALPICSNCGDRMVPSGACFACQSCGNTSGCS